MERPVTMLKVIRRDRQGWLIPADPSRSEVIGALNMMSAGLSQK